MRVGTASALTTKARSMVVRLSDCPAGALPPGRGDVAGDGRDRDRFQDGVGEQGERRSALAAPDARRGERGGAGQNRAAG
jgi:hypothetical protein